MKAIGDAGKITMKCWLKCVCCFMLPSRRVKRM